MIQTNKTFLAFEKVSETSNILECKLPLEQNSVGENSYWTIWTIILIRRNFLGVMDEIDIRREFPKRIFLDDNSTDENGQRHSIYAYIRCGEHNVELFALLSDVMNS